MSCPSDGEKLRPGRKNGLSAERLAELAERIRGGTTLKAAAGETDYTPCGLRGALERAGHDVSALVRESRGETPERLHELGQRLRAGEGMAYAAEQVGFSYDQARRLLDQGQLGLTPEQMRTAAEEKRTRDRCAQEQAEKKSRGKRGVKLTHDQLVAAYNLLRGGSEWSWAAENVGASVGGLRKAMQRAGYDIGTLKLHAGPKRLFTPERGRLAEQMVSEGVSLTETAAALGVRVATLSTWNKKGWVSVCGRLRRHRRHTDDELRRMHARYMAEPQASVAEIARIYHIGPETMCARWRKLGLAIDSKRRYQQMAATKRARTAARRTPECLAQAWQKYKTGYVSAEDLRREYGMAWKSIKAGWREMGYDVDGVVRRKREWMNGKRSRNTI